MNDEVCELLKKLDKHKGVEHSFVVFADKSWLVKDEYRIQASGASIDDIQELRDYVDEVCPKIVEKWVVWFGDEKGIYASVCRKEPNPESWRDYIKHEKITCEVPK